VAAKRGSLSLKRIIGVLVIAICLVSFLAWNLQASEQTEQAMFMRALIGGLLAGGGALSWIFLVRKPPARRDP
jgi:hypothetical protein